MPTALQIHSIADAMMCGSETLENQLLKIDQLDSFECGSTKAKEQFSFDKGYVFLNHGTCSHKDTPNKRES